MSDSTHMSVGQIAEKLGEPVVMRLCIVCAEPVVGRDVYEVLDTDTQATIWFCKTCGKVITDAGLWSCPPEEDD